VLVTLYNATDGPNWAQNTNWLSDKPLREWHGVHTDGRGRVWHLNLASNNLKGELPPELGGLSNLTRLGLSDNQLTGEIPAELGGLSALTSLGLYTNQLAGDIPPALGNLSNLTYLNLSSNQLTGEIPPALGGLASLTHLNLSSNQLTGEIPPALGSLANLTWLGLHYNQLTGEIPPELGRLASLETLSLGANQLSGEIPPQLGSLANLTDLGLGNNQLTGKIPPALGSLANLTHLNLGANQLAGEIPTELGDLSALTSLRLYTNQLTGEIPTELGRLANLEALNLGFNQLTGEIPPELGSLANLESLYLGGNGLQACLPDELTALRDIPIGDVQDLPECGGSANQIIFTTENKPLLYNDSVFVLPITRTYRMCESCIARDTRTFFRYFRDSFDFLVAVRNLHGFSYRTEDYDFGPLYGARMIHVANSIRGTGLSTFDRRIHFGSNAVLKGVDETVLIDGIFGDTLLHEIAHLWANHITPREGSISAHWGFSSANGVLGGFDLADLVDHGDGRYSAGSFDTNQTTFPKPYSPIELYLAGLIPPEEVPDLWVAEDGAWLDEYAEDGDRLFTASEIKTYSIEDIIRQHGRRVPGPSRSQRDFRAAVILLIDEEHPLHLWQLELASRKALAPHDGPDESDEYNFYEATGGRATLAMGDLSRFLKRAGAASVPGAPAEPTASGNIAGAVTLSWGEPANIGGLTITNYDLRYRATSAGAPAGSDWTVLEGIWSIGDGDLLYTLSALAGSEQFDLQVRAVNGAGAGAWSATTTGVPGAADQPWPRPHCLKGDIAPGFSLVVYEGGTVQELAACAESRGLAVLHALDEGAYVSYISGAPDAVNQAFRELYPDGVPALTALVAGSSGPPGEDPAGYIGRLPSGSQCLHGEIAEGFSLVVYEGGSVEELAACAQSLNVTVVYTLAKGEWVSYTPGAPESANQAFVGLFADGVPAITPLVAKSDESLEASSGRDRN
jgi:Leucine-rich repeat (LRR) protein